MVVILQQTTDNGKRFVSTVVEEEVSLLSNSSGLSSQNSVTERSAIYKQRIDSLFGYTTKPTMAGHKSSGSSGRIRKLDFVQSSEDEGYQRIDEEMDSLLPSDSLNQKINVRDNCQDSFPPHAKPYVPNRIPATKLIAWKTRAYCNTSTRFVSNLQGEGDSATHLGAQSSSSGGKGMVQFPVEYLGSVPVEGTTTTLQDLQPPLCSLYLNFLRRQNMTSGSLSIVGEGLRFDSPRLHLLNPFQTISVWAAIKFVARGTPVPSDCAFMPLISDPEGQDKRRLFGPMDTHLAQVYANQLKLTGKGFRNPPIFACVTRETNLSRHQLGTSPECHAFTCKSAEDAIVVAANLYQYLLVNELKINKEGESGYGSLSRSSPPVAHFQSPPVNNQGVNENRLFSSTSSVLSPTDDTSCCGSISFTTSGNEVLQGPVRPPRRNKKQSAAGDAMRYNSDESLMMIPQRRRRKSFKVTANRFQRNPTKTNKKKVKIATPEESAAETALHESIDQILDKVVSPGGMSLDDLKPSCKKLILKLALTLTQGQLQKKRQHLGFPIYQSRREEMEEQSHWSGNFFKRGASGKPIGYKRVHGGKTGRNPLINGNKSKAYKMIPRRSRDEEHFQSICTGCFCDSCSEKCYCSLPMKKKQNLKIVGSRPVTTSNGGQPSSENKSANKCHQPMKKGCGYDTESCADSEKCYCSLQGVKSNGLKVYNINLDTETSESDTNSYDLEPFAQNNAIGENQQDYNGTKHKAPVSPVKMVSYKQDKTRSGAPSSTLDSKALPPLPQQSLDKNRNGILLQKPKNQRQLGANSDHFFEGGHKDRSSPSLRQRKKVLLLTGPSPSRRQLVYGGQQDKLGQGRAGHQQLDDISEREGFSSGAGDESSRTDMDDSLLNSLQVLDMKKTAEIEAMFTTLKIDENMKCVNEELARHRRFINSGKANGHGQANHNISSIDFQTSSGYLP